MGKKNRGVPSGTRGASFFEGVSEALVDLLGTRRGADDDRHRHCVRASGNEDETGAHGRSSVVMRNDVSMRKLRLAALVRPRGFRNVTNPERRLPEPVRSPIMTPSASPR